MGPLIPFLYALVATSILSKDDAPESFGGDGVPRGRRRLTDEEEVELRKIFGDSLPYRELRLRGRNIRGEDLAYTKLPRRERKAARVVTVDRGYVRSLGPSGSVDDLYARSLGPLPDGPLLAHEFMHSWLDYHRSGGRTGGTDEEAAAFDLPDEALYDLWWWVQRDVPFTRWPNEAKANAAAWYWNGLYANPTNPDHSWYVRIPMVDRLFEHVRDHGALPTWSGTATPSSFSNGPLVTSR